MLEKRILGLRVAVLTACVLLSLPGYAQPALTALREWRAGVVVDSLSIVAYGGLERCFVAEAIPDAVWRRMQGKSYTPNPQIGRSDLRHVRLLHRDLDGHTRIGEMVCNAQIAKKVVGIMRSLYDGGYPIESVLLPDVFDADDERQMRANNTSCFCYRSVAGTSRLSKHARGLAIDLNPLYNPYCKPQRDGTCIVRPATASAFCDRRRDFPCKIDRQDLAYRLFTRAGFVWGGSWRSCKDYQHFEY